MKRATVRYVALVGVTLGLAFVGGQGALAHGGAEGVVKDRMEVMEDFGKSMKAMTAMFQGQVEYDPQFVRQKAQEIAEHGGDALVDLFPKGTEGHPSEALPSVWSKPDQFRDLARDLAAYAKALATAADNGGAVGTGIGMPGNGASMGTMMGQGNAGMGAMMGGGAASSMMGGQGGVDAETLATMPPQAAFMHLADTCGACHDSYRAKSD